MKILILSWRGPKHPHAGGAEIATLEHAIAWKKAGYDVTWFTSSFEGGLNTEKIKGVEIIRQGNQFFGVQAAAFYWYCFTKHSKFDLVIDQFHGLPFFTPLYVHTKVLAFIHEVAKDVWQLNQWPQPFNTIPAVLGPIGEPYIFKLLYKKINFMTVSESTKKDLIEWGIKPKNITVIYNGANIINPPSSIKKEKTSTIMFLGAVAKDKGVFDAVEVFGKLNKKFTKIQFWIVGKADKVVEKQIKRNAKKLGITKNLKIWGFVSEKKKFELLKRAYIMINPSIREGWGLVNIEANSMGTPVFGYKVPGIVDSVKINTSGILVEKHDTNKLSREIGKLIQSGRYTKLSKSCEKWAKMFTWDKSTKQSLELINKTLNAGKTIRRNNSNIKRKTRSK